MIKHTTVEGHYYVFDVAHSPSNIIKNESLRDLNVNEELATQFDRTLRHGAHIADVVPFHKSNTLFKSPRQVFICRFYVDPITQSGSLVRMRHSDQTVAQTAENSWTPIALQ